MVKPDHSIELQRNELRGRLRRLESELSGLQTELARLGPEAALPGLFVLADLGAQVVALPSSTVLEVVRLVKVTPLPDAPRHVLGTFVYRGEPALALDVRRYLGEKDHEPDVDAHMLVLSTGRMVALVVDRVRALVEAPALAQAPAGAPAWVSSPLVGALCQVEGELVGVLRVEPLLEGVPA